jgi:hypothetical protein
MNALPPLNDNLIIDNPSPSTEAPTTDAPPSSQFTFHTYIDIHMVILYMDHMVLLLHYVPRLVFLSYMVLLLYMALVLHFMP